MPKNKLITPEIAKKLRAGVKRALEVPEGFVMETWIRYADTPCVTAGCYAYELAVACGRYKPQTLLKKQMARTGWSIARYAAKLIGLPHDVLNTTLFHADHWPKKFERRYDNAKTGRGRAKALEAAIEDFIAKDGNW